MADRVGGRVDPVPHLADRLTEPADLARSPFYQYLFTLVREEDLNRRTQRTQRRELFFFHLCGLCELLLKRFDRCIH